MYGASLLKHSLRNQAFRKTMIKVNKLRSESLTGAVRLYCDYECDNSSDRLWFEVSNDYAKYLSIECGDAFFVALVLLAHHRGKDISFDTPVSKRLYYGVIEVLLPGLRIVNPELPVIKVVAEIRDFNFNPTGAGTALSLGVDSFHAVASSFKGPFPVTHLTLFNGGAFGDDGGDASRALFLRTAESASLAAAEMKLPLITVDSNMSEILNISFARTHSIRNLSFALLFPQLFRQFYYASGYPAVKFKLDASSVDATYYDLLVSKALCTETFEVMVAGLHDERIKKISTIASFPPSTRHLNVCILAESNETLIHSGKQVKNCSRCFKCVKTMAAMDALGVLDAYSHVFDLEVYRSQRMKYLGRILYDAKKLKSSHEIEILQEGRKSPGFIPLQVYYYAFARGFRNLIRKIRPKTEKAVSLNSHGRSQNKGEGL